MQVHLAIGAGGNEDHPYEDPVKAAVNHFAQPSQTKGRIAVAKELGGLFIGSFIAPFSENGSRYMAGDLGYRATLVANFNPTLDRLNAQIAEQNVVIANLEQRLGEIEGHDGLEVFEVQRKLLAAKETCELTKRLIVQQKASALTQMRAYYGDDKTQVTANAEFVKELEELHRANLAQLDLVENRLAVLQAQKEEQGNRLTQLLLLALPTEVMPSHADVEKAFDLAKHPWKRGGALQFLKETLNLAETDEEAVKRALAHFNAQFDGRVTDLKERDLQQLIIAIEKTVAKNDPNSPMARALNQLKGLLCTAVFEHPDELRRVLSLATFLCVAGMTGGVAGLIAGSAAKVTSDYFLQRALPTPVNENPTVVSDVLRVVEAGVMVASGGVGATAAYAASELAHQLIPERLKPVVVAGALVTGFGAHLPAAAVAAVAIAHPYNLTDAVAAVPQAVDGLFKPDPLARLKKGICNFFSKIKEAAEAKRWGEVALRVCAIVLPILVIIGCCLHPVLALIGLTAILFDISVGLVGLSAVATFVGLFMLNEKRNKEETLKKLREWKDAYVERTDPAYRDAGVVSVFEELESQALLRHKLTLAEFVKLLKTHLPSLRDFTEAQIAAAFQELAATHVNGAEQIAAEEAMLEQPQEEECVAE